MKRVLVILLSVSLIPMALGASDPSAAQKQYSENAARYYKALGYNFDPNVMTVHEMDRKVEVIKRANYWKKLGYDFDPNVMAPYEMDIEAKRIAELREAKKTVQRADYWKKQGYNFDPNVMTVYEMDEEAERIAEIRYAKKNVQRARYWEKRGHNFDPNVMTAYEMDEKAERIAEIRDAKKNVQSARYWKEITQALEKDESRLDTAGTYLPMPSGKLHSKMRIRGSSNLPVGAINVPPRISHFNYHNFLGSTEHSVPFAPVGALGVNRYNPDSLANPYGAGSPYKVDGLMNPYSQYGSPYSNKSWRNPYATDAPKLYDSQDNYRGKFSTNPYDSDSISNPYGKYGSPYSPESIRNPYGAGNPYSNNPIYVVPSK